MANRSKSRRPAASRAASERAKRARAIAAQGRLDVGHPIAVIDIGSNSVRLVIYEGLTRSPTPIFNEKVLAGLGREVQSTGLLAADAVEKALAALRRFRALCDTAGVKRAVVRRDRRLPRRRQRPGLHRRRPSASAASASRCCPASARRKLSALGVVSGIYRPDGIVGDLGGGSLELVDVHGHQLRAAASRCRSAASRCRTSRKSRSRRPRRSCARRCAARRCCKQRRGPHASTRSAAPGARSRGCTCGRPAIRCT